MHATHMFSKVPVGINRVDVWVDTPVEAQKRGCMHLTSVADSSWVLEVPVSNSV